MASLANLDITPGNAAVEKEFANTAPEYIFSLLAMTQLSQNWDASIMYYYLGEMEAIGNSSLNDPIRKLDVRAAYAFRSHRLDGEFSLVGQNIGGDYDGLYPFNRVDERWIAHLKLSF